MIEENELEGNFDERVNFAKEKNNKREPEEHQDAWGVEHRKQFVSKLLGEVASTIEPLGYMNLIHLTIYDHTEKTKYPSKNYPGGMSAKEFWRGSLILDCFRIGRSIYGREYINKVKGFMDQI